MDGLRDYPARVDLQIGCTAVVVMVPAAQDLVERVREEFGARAAVCAPPHVTVLYPWLRVGDVTRTDLADLARICADVPAFDVTFSRFGVFPGVLWLAPDPTEPFAALTAAMARQWPHTPPYGGLHPVVIPHLSVMDLDAAGIDTDDETAVKDAVERLTPWLPVVHRVEELSFVRFDGVTCPTIQRLRLAAA